jgi:long-chain acyl-CoA synthetase
MKLFFLGFRAYFSRPLIKNLIKLMKVIPVDPAAELVNAMQAAAFVIRNKRSLCVFPEGQRSIDGQVKGFKKGIGILAKELGVTLVPVYITGSFRAWPRGQGFPKLATIKIVFGRPFGVKSDNDYETIAAGLRQEVLKLKDRLL